MSQESVERLRRLTDALNAGEVPEFVAAGADLYRAEPAATAETV